jgi:site-specific DNA-methyltransferase (adenine-specific)
MMELRAGDYREVLADVERVDAVICDPPYSERTHGSRYGEQTDGADRRWLDGAYSAWGAGDVAALYRLPVAGWIVAMTDHALAPAYEAAAREAGRYTFAPLPIVEPGRNVRLCGDGPACWGIWMMASRPRELSRWGALPGAYIAEKAEKEVVGGKPLALMRAIVRDYSRPGDLVCDPCAGGGTTLLAAAMEGRRAIGAELDPATFAKAVKRLSRGYTPPLIVSERAEPEQIALGEVKP